MSTKPAAHLTGWTHQGTNVYFGDGGVSTHACGEDKQQQIDRARLMAAAPRLLLACRQAIVALKGREHDGFLREAIALATEQQWNQAVPRLVIGTCGLCDGDRCTTRCESDEP